MKVYRNKKTGREIIRSYDKILSLWGVEYEEVDVKTGHGSTHVIICGDRANPPLVLFHGVGDDSALMWIYNAKTLSKHYCIYAIDTIGGPGKSVPGELYNKDFDDVEWIEQVLIKLGVSRAYFAGVSHGGYLVQVYSLYRPAQVIKAISISGAVSVGEKKSPMSTMIKIFLPEALFPTKKNVKKLIEKLCGENSAIFTDNEAIMEHYTFLLKGFNNMAMAYHKVKTFSEEELKVVREKVEFLVGLDDPFEKLGGERALRDNDMKVTFYENAGHGLNHERADEINAKIMEIFNESIVK